MAGVAALASKGGYDTSLDWVGGPEMDASQAAALTAQSHSVSFKSEWQRQQFAAYVASGAGTRPPWSY